MTTFVWGAVILVLVVGGAVGGTMWMTWSFRRKQDALHALPRTMIADLAAGARVRVVGLAYALGDTTVAPLSGKRCIAYDSKTFIDGDNGSRGRKSQQVVPFQVADESGKIGLALDCVSLDLALLVPEREGPQLRSFGDSIIQRESRAQGFGGVDHFEGILEPEQKVAVIGTVERAPDGSLRLTGTPAQPLVISTEHAAFLR